MTAAHKEIAWGVQLVKYPQGKYSDTTWMSYSNNASQILTLGVGDDLWLRVFAFKSKVDEAAFLALVNSTKTQKEEFSKLVKQRISSLEAEN